MTSNAASTESNAADAKWRMLRMRKEDSKVSTEAAEASDSPLWTMDCERDERTDGRTDRQRHREAQEERVGVEKKRDDGMIMGLN